MILKEPRAYRAVLEPLVSDRSIRDTQRRTGSKRQRPLLRKERRTEEGRWLPFSITRGFSNPAFHPPRTRGARELPSLWAHWRDVGAIGKCAVAAVGHRPRGPGEFSPSPQRGSMQTKKISKKGGLLEHRRRGEGAAAKRRAKGKTATRGA